MSKPVVAPDSAALLFSGTAKYSNLQASQFQSAKASAHALLWLGFSGTAKYSNLQSGREQKIVHQSSKPVVAPDPAALLFSGTAKYSNLQASQFQSAKASAHAHMWLGSSGTAKYSNLQSGREQTIVHQPGTQACKHLILLKFVAGVQQRCKVLAGWIHNRIHSMWIRWLDTLSLRETRNRDCRRTPSLAALQGAQRNK
jgi:hypothetical protein